VNWFKYVGSFITHLLISFAVAQIVARASTEDMMVQYNIPAFTRGDRDAFLSGVARATGLIRKVCHIRFVVIFSKLEHPFLFATCREESSTSQLLPV